MITTIEGIDLSDFEKILEVMKSFPDVKRVNLIHEDSSGIGSCLDVEFTHKLNGQTITSKIEICGVDRW
jgi:hypothetical protein